LEVESKEREYSPAEVLCSFQAKPPKAKVDVPTGVKGKFETRPKHVHDVKCFECEGHEHYAYGSFFLVKVTNE